MFVRGLLFVFAGIAFSVLSTCTDVVPADSGPSTSIKVDSFTHLTKRSSTSLVIFSSDKCPRGADDWFKEGYSHGSQGYRDDRDFVDRVFGPSCGKQSLPIDYAAYKRGVIEGRKRYCTVDNAYWIGRDRGDVFIRENCPNAIIAELTHANNAGLTARYFEEKIRRIESKEVPGVPRYQQPTYWELPEEDRTELDRLERRLEALPKYPKP